MFIIYTIIYLIIIVILLPFEYLKRPIDLRKRWLREKFGFINPQFQTSQSTHPSFNKWGQGGIIWVHTVSVGEVMAALPLLKTLKNKYPEKRFVISTITDTGQRVAKEKSPEDTTIIYSPFDIPLIIKKTINRLMPDILILIETELWPNMLRGFKKNNIPIILLNGRISENSFKGYKKISFFMKKVLSCIDFFGMQNELYAERIKSFGINSNRVTALGNFKFDTSPSSKIPEWTRVIKGPVIIAGSTHEGEEDIILSVYKKLKNDFPDLNLILAPRHPERFKRVEEILKSHGLTFKKRSTIKNYISGLEHIKGEIILLDTIGELSAIYAISTVAIIGKSFKGYGGQNPLEPAYWGKPIICGSHMENFPLIEEFYREKAAIEVSEERLYPVIKEILLSPEKAKEMGIKAKQLYKNNSGAVDKAINIIEKYIS